MTNGAKFIGAFILLLVLFATTDKRNSCLPDCLVPFVVFVTILGNAVAFGAQTGMLCLFPHPLFFNSSLVGFAINPARDLGPRIMTDGRLRTGHRIGAAVSSRSQSLISSLNRSVRLL